MKIEIYLFSLQTVKKSIFLQALLTHRFTKLPMLALLFVLTAVSAVSSVQANVQATVQSQAETTTTTSKEQPSNHSDTEDEEQTLITAHCVEHTVPTVTFNLDATVIKIPTYDFPELAKQPFALPAAPVATFAVVQKLVPICQSPQAP